MPLLFANGVPWSGCMYIFALVELVRIFSSSDEYSLKEDRQALDQLRKDIPEPIKEITTNLYTHFKFNAQDTAHPSEVRNKYQSLERKKRTLL